MAYQFITLKREGRSRPCLNRPPTNPLSAAFGRELFDAFTEVDRMEDVTVVIITSALEKAFVAGADIKEMAAMDRAASEASRCFYKRRSTSPEDEEGRHRRHQRPRPRRRLRAGDRGPITVS